MSFETSFDRKQSKLEPKLVSVLSETKCLFQLFCFYTETESFGVSLEPKQTEEQPKQFDREHILVLFQKIFGCFGLFWFVSDCFETVCFGCFSSMTKQRVLMFRLKPKQTEDQSKQFHREHILVFFRRFRVVSVSIGLLRNSSVCFKCFDIGLKHRNKPKQPKKFCFWFHKTNRNRGTLACGVGVGGTQFRRRDRHSGSLCTK